MQWRGTQPVLDFVDEYATEEPARGGMVRFEDVPVSRVHRILAEAPEEVLLMASDNGPTNVTLLSFAASVEGTLGGSISVPDREDVTFILDCIYANPGVTPLAYGLPGADEVVWLPDDRVCHWWD